MNVYFPRNTCFLWFTKMLPGMRELRLAFLFRSRIVRNRAAEKAKESITDGRQTSPSMVGEAGSPHLSQNSSPSLDAMQRAGTYSISGILGITSQNAQHISDPAVMKRKLEEQSGIALFRIFFPNNLLFIINMPLANLTYHAS